MKFYEVHYATKSDGHSRDLVYASDYNDAVAQANKIGDLWMIDSIRVADNYTLHTYFDNYVEKVRNSRNNG